MLSVLRAASPQQQVNDPRTKFKTVLGLGTPQKDTQGVIFQRVAPVNNSARQQQHVSGRRRSVDTATVGIKGQRKDESELTRVVDTPFFEDDAVTVPKSVDIPDSMKNGIAPRPIPSRRSPFRVDGQDGPWTISVAETAHDATSYNLYIKTPTHNLTLTRTSVEIVELDGKLRDTLPGVKLPKLPIDASNFPSPPKRKSNFLNTLSRLASPSSKSAGLRQASSSRTSSSAARHQSRPSASATPVASPSQEISDPFASFASEDGDAKDSGLGLTSTNSAFTNLAAYLTTIANDSSVRQTRVWKRFVRVRTDDLQSVRAERAIKRIRSDLAAHSSPGSSGDGPRSLSQVLGDAESSTPVAQVLPASAQDQPTDEMKSTPARERVVLDDPQGQQSTDASVSVSETIVTDKTEDVSAASADTVAVAVDHSVESQTVPEDSNLAEDTNGRSTPTPSDTASIRHSRVPRSQSAEPSARVSRIYSSGSGISSTLRDGTSSKTSIAEDDSSISTTGRRSNRKKRSKSTDPNASLQKKKSQRKVVIDDFEMMRVLGKGCAGKVLLVRHRTSGDIYALKAITKRHVLAHQELQHTLTEQAVLKRMAAEGTDPFVVKLWWSFHDKENLFLVMDFHPGGDLATQLARWGRLGRDRARFYAAEIVEGVEGLHAAGVIYRDLKPENILIGADGHIVLTDFGLSKEFPRRTTAITAPPTPSGSRNEFMGGMASPASPPWMKGENGQGTVNPWTGSNDSTSTFCGTAEYLAPEVIQGLPYSYEVDWWSFGTMLYEMLTGITPFWANNHSDMYFRVLQDELQFPDDKAMDQDTKSLIRGLLQRNPALRMKEPRIKKHPYFCMIEWPHVYHKRYIPPYIPPIDPSNASDTQNFDDTFLDMEPVINDDEDNEQTDTDVQTDNDKTDGEDSVTTPSQSRSSSVPPVEDDTLFDGYSFKGRHSVILDDGDEEADGDESGDEDEDEDGDDDDEPQKATADIIDSTEQPPQSQADLSPLQSPPGEMATVDEVPEPATPEAIKSTLLIDTEPAPADVQTPVEAKAKELPPVIAPQESPVAAPAPKAEKAPASSAQETIIVKAPVPRAAAKPRSRREKSGVPALDRAYDAADEDGTTTERDDEEDDDWDFVETNVHEERNGAKGTSLFARGVVDRYRLAVFRKSTPRRRTSARDLANLPTDSDVADPSDSPTPVEKQRRGRNQGLTFRRTPKEFLRTKSPSRTSSVNKSSTQSPLASGSAPSVNSSALLTPATSVAPTLPTTPSLKSKESAISVGSPSESSDQSLNGERNVPVEPVRAVVTTTPEEKQKSKGLKKYKEGAEKVLSIFQSPR